MEDRPGTWRPVTRYALLPALLMAGLLWPATVTSRDLPAEALCRLLWLAPGEAPLPEAVFPEAQLFWSGGDEKAAAKKAEERLVALLVEAERIFRDGTAGIETARAFIDTNVTGKKAVLAQRGELLVPALPVATRMARLHCLAGNREQALAYGKAAWRDYRQEELRVNAVLLALRFEDASEAQLLAPEKPVTWREQAAAAAVYCALEQDQGRVSALFFDAAKEAGGEDDRALLRQLEAVCRN